MQRWILKFLGTNNHHSKTTCCHENNLNLDLICTCLNPKFTITIFKCWIRFEKPVLGDVNGSLQFLTGSVKPSLQHLQFCCFGFLFSVFYYSLFPCLYYAFIYLFPFNLYGISNTTMVDTTVYTLLLYSFIIF